jgi:phage shock protein PspC (stress-responsive transcriptional regulator)
MAGVAAGIARRYRIDPTLVRVGFVVAALYGGAGVVLYLLGWLLLPEEGDEVSPFESLIGRGRSSTSSAFTVLLCLAMIPIVSWFFGGFFPGFPGFLSVIVVVGALYLLHRGRGHLGRPADVPDTGQQYATPPPPDPTMPMSTPMSTPQQGPQPTLPLDTDQAVDPATGEPPPIPERQVPPDPDRPPAWDPLGAAPFAWDLPEPTPQPSEEDEPPPPQRRSKSRIGLLTAGVALITAAVLSAVTGGWINPQHIVGVVLAVLGLGLVIGSFQRGGRGLIALAIPLAAIGIGMTAVFPDGVHGGVGDLQARPASLSEVLPRYERGVGAIELDMTDLPESGSVETRIDLGLGDVQVILPETADVEVTCKSDLGDVKCLGHEESGPSEMHVESKDDGTDGPGGLNVDLRVEVGTGSVEVRRG